MKSFGKPIAFLVVTVLFAAVFGLEKVWWGFEVVVLTALAMIVSLLLILVWEE